MMAEKKTCPRCSKGVRFKADGTPWKHQCPHGSPCVVSETGRNCPMCRTKAEAGTTLARLVSERCPSAFKVAVAQKTVGPGFRPVAHLGNFLEIMTMHPGGEELELTIFGKCNRCEEVHQVGGASIIMLDGQTPEEMFSRLAESGFFLELDKRAQT